MERLTKRLKNGSVVCRLKFEKPSSCDDDCAKCLHDMKAWNKLAEYEDLEENGLLLKLPCKIGDRVYVFSKEWNRAYPITVASIVICKNCLFIRNGYGESFCFGTEAFLTFSEAEAALAEMETH